MLELLLATQSGGYYPHSGPGTKTLRTGDQELGFFGIVTDEELGNASEALYSAINASSYFSNIQRKLAAPLWSKWFYKQKVVYYPLTAITYGVTVHDIAAAGLLTGNDRQIAFHQNGSAPITTLFRVQNRRLSVKEGQRPWSLRVRQPNPVAPLTRFTTTAAADSEIAKIVLPLYGYGSTELSLTDRWKQATFIDNTDRIVQTSGIYNYRQGNASQPDQMIYNTDLVAGQLYVTGNALSVLPPVASAPKQYYRPMLELDPEPGSLVTEVWPLSDPRAIANFEFDGQEIASLEAIHEIKQLSYESATLSDDVLYSQAFGMDTSFRERAASTTSVVEVGAKTEITTSSERVFLTTADSAGITSEYIKADNIHQDCGAPPVPEQVREISVQTSDSNSDTISDITIRQVFENEKLFADKVIGEVIVVDAVNVNTAGVDLNTQVRHIETQNQPYWLLEPRYELAPRVSYEPIHVSGTPPIDVIAITQSISLKISLEKV